MPNVVFPCGLVSTRPPASVRLYYGAADTSICLATARLDDLLGAVMTAPGTGRHPREAVLIAIAVPGAPLAWLVLLQVWILLLWCGRGRSPFTRRLDQLLALLLPETAPTRRRTGFGRGGGSGPCWGRVVSAG